MRPSQEEIALSCIFTPQIDEVAMLCSYQQNAGASTVDANDTQQAIGMHLVPEQFDAAARRVVRPRA
jgi:hypothetical protein